MRLRKVYPQDKQDKHVTAISTLASIPISIMADPSHASIDGADVVLSNVECDNGIIHTLDKVLCSSIGMDYYDAGGINT
jgi:uncharacterized surface protein with fasciclin (FAS1) repeats